MVQIAYVINYIVKNGPSNVILNLIENLDKSEYSISLITLFEGNDAKVVSDLRNKGVVVYECKTLSRIKCLLGQHKEFSNIVEEGRFDILHTHGIIPDLLSARAHTTAKRITTLHNNMYEDYLATYGYAKSRIFIALHLSALKKLSQCVCCSKSVYDVMRYKLDNVSFIRNGIESVRANTVVTRSEIGIPENARIFLYAGVLNSQKNVAWLIENFVQYHQDDEYLLVLGSGEKEAECREKADAHVRMLGFQADPVAYMNISDVYVSASKSEGFSISVLEALSCGLGLLLSDIPSHREVVEMGVDAYLGETFTQQDFPNKLSKLRSGKLCQEKIAQFQGDALSAKTMTQQYEGLYIDRCSGGNS